jgi:hypothetical protein
MLNLDELKREIQDMNSRRKIYKILRAELRKAGYWRNKPRGNPKKGLEIAKKNKEAKGKSVV